MTWNTQTSKHLDFNKFSMNKIKFLQIFSDSFAFRHYSSLPPHPLCPFARHGKISCLDYTRGIAMGAEASYPGHHMGKGAPMVPVPASSTKLPFPRIISVFQKNHC